MDRSCTILVRIDIDIARIRLKVRVFFINFRDFYLWIWYQSVIRGSIFHVRIDMHYEYLKVKLYRNFIENYIDRRNKNLFYINKFSTFLVFHQFYWNLLRSCKFELICITRYALRAFKSESRNFIENNIDRGNKNLFL